MRELRMLLAAVLLLLLATFTSSALARESEDDDHSRVSIRSTHEIDDDHDDRESAREHLQKVREKNKERAKKLREKKKNSYSQTGVTMTGATRTGTTKPPVTTPVKPVNPAPTTPVVSSVTHSATVSYGTPEGPVSVGFSVTAKSGIITAVSTTKKAGGTSGYYQDTFAQKITSAAVGKKTAGLNLAAVGGASLTTTAFEKFVAANF